MTIWTYEKAVFQSKLAASTKLVLLALNSHVNRLGTSCFPSYSRLVEFTSLKRSTVIEHIKIAEAEGWLKRISRFGEDGKQRSNLFHLQVPHHIMMASDASEIDEEEEEVGGPESGRGGSSNRTGGVQQVDPEQTTLTNHSKVSKRKGIPVVLPDWLDVELWDEWVAHRKTRDKGAASDHAKRLWIKEMTALHEAGHDLRAIIEKSISKNWKGIFAPSNDTVVGCVKRPASLNDMDYSADLF